MPGIGIGRTWPIESKEENLTIYEIIQRFGDVVAKKLTEKSGELPSDAIYRLKVTNTGVGNKIEVLIEDNFVDVSDYAS